MARWCAVSSQSVISILAILSCGIRTVHAQVQTVGHFQHGSFAAITDLGRILYRVPPLNVARVLAQETEEAQRTVAKRPYKFGEPIKLNVDARKAGEWSITNDGRAKVWRAIVQSPGAQSLAVIFDRFYLPEGAELYVLGRNQTLGAFVGKVNNKEDGQFFTTPLPGDTLVLEYWEPLKAGTKPLPRNKVRAPGGNSSPPERSVEIRVSGVIYGFRKVLESDNGYQDSQPCNVDVACPLGRQHNESINAVGMLIMATGVTCTGVMLNNPRQDGRQLFLTADHCIRQWMQSSKFLVAFNYQHSVCASAGVPVNCEPEVRTVQGMRLLARWERSDFALFEILEDIPDAYRVFYAGWSRSLLPPVNVTSIHHPMGDVKKISAFQGATVLATEMSLLFPYHWNIEAWTHGVTEQGSSGSPLFNAHGQVVGHLYGGTSSCSNPMGFDLYGALAYDWMTADKQESWIKPFLDPEAKGVVAVSGSYYQHQGKHGKLKAPLRNATIEIETPKQN